MKEKLYDNIYKFCATLTNHYILFNPVTDDDVSKYTLHRKRKLYKDGFLRAWKESDR